MMDTMVIALEAAWELDPVRLEDKLWGTIERTVPAENNSVEYVSKSKREKPLFKGINTI